VETITTEDGRIEFVLDEGAGQQAPSSAAPRTAPQDAVVSPVAARAPIERLRALPRWMVAAPIAALLLALGLAFGLGGEEGEREDEAAGGGFRPYGGGPVDGKGRGEARGAPALNRGAPAPAEEAVEEGFDVSEEPPGEVRAAAPAQLAPGEVAAPIIPTTFKPQELNSMNPGLTDEQRKLLQGGSLPALRPPVEAVPADVEPVEQPSVDEGAPSLEVAPQDEAPRGELLPNGGYQEPYEDRDPSTIGPPPLPEQLEQQNTALPQ
jgi:hypothetical protein